jgi:toxin FitB
VSFLLDTNVISELRRKRPDARVVAWLKRAGPTTLWISVLTLGDIAKGAARCAARDRAQAETYYRWLALLRSNYADRTIAIDADICEAWGRLAANRPLPVIDGLLAATALARGLTLVTRNVRDFAGVAIGILNPWEA